MACDFFALAQPGVRQLSPYQPGKPIDELARELDLDPKGIIKLASNENPTGPSRMVTRAIEDALPELTRYPDGSGFELKRKLADRYAVGMDQITLGNGSNDILDLVSRSYLAPGLNAVFSAHAFAAYPLCVRAVNAESKIVPAKNWGHDLGGILAAIDEQTRIIFIANPNNPTGTWFSAPELEAFLRQVPESVLVVLDEAYIEYAEPDELPDGLRYLDDHPNLLVSRTFSKAYGLASLRVGYSFSSAVIADVLNRVRQPFNVNSLAMVAACAALDDPAYVVESRRLNSAGMRQLEEGFRQLGLSWIPSKGNFIAVDFGRDASPIYEALLREGVIVRPVTGYGMPTFLRITVGTLAENAQFLQVLGRVLQHV